MHLTGVYNVRHVNRELCYLLSYTQIASSSGPSFYDVFVQHVAQWESLSMTSVPPEC